LIGNEDCGQMSAWYIFSAMGMYPVCPGFPQYVLGEPVFNDIKLNLENGKQFSIHSAHVQGRPVTGISLNGQVLRTSFIGHPSIMAGHSLTFLNEELNGRPNEYGVEGKDKPLSYVRGVSIIPAPLIRAEKQVFRDSLRMSIETINTPAQLISLYTVDGSDPNINSRIYSKPLLIDSTCRIKAQVFASGDNSAITEARFFKLKNDYVLSIGSKLHEQYSADGAQTLIDGIKGDSDWRKGNWLGCWGQDFVCTADLKKRWRSITLTWSACRTPVPGSYSR